MKKGMFAAAAKVNNASQAKPDPKGNREERRAAKKNKQKGKGYTP